MISYETQQILEQHLVEEFWKHQVRNYKSAIHDCPVKGPNPMYVAAKNNWKYCPFCNECLVK